jgi:hypothetical protein
VFDATRFHKWHISVCPMRWIRPNRCSYEADTSAAIYLDEESNAFLEEINPGNSVNGVILFDIPKDAQIVKLELHDSAFSGGVTVNV